MDPASLWNVSASFTPDSGIGFLKLRTADILQSSPDNQIQHLYIFVPPERIASISVEAGPIPSVIHMRLVLEQHGDIVGPIHLSSPGNGTEADEQLLACTRWLATRPALAISVFHSRLTLDRWQQFCDACTDGSLQTDPVHADLTQLYGRRGGHVINTSSSTDIPPAYDDHGPLVNELQSSRKRQRTSPVPDPEALGKGFDLYMRTMCTEIVARQRDEMIAPLLARMKEMEDRIIDTVMDNVEGLLQRRLAHMHEELQGGVDETLDNHVDTFKEEIREQVTDQVKEQVEEQVGSIQEDIADIVMERIA